MAYALYAHDLDGSPSDLVAHELRRQGFEVVAPDGRFRTLTRRVEDLAAAASDQGEIVLVGSGSGALAVIGAANSLGSRVRAVVLLSPSLGWVEPPVWDPGKTGLPDRAQVWIAWSDGDLTTQSSDVDHLVARYPRIETTCGPVAHDAREVARRVRLLVAPTPAPRSAPRAKARAADVPSATTRRGAARRLPMRAPSPRVVVAHDLSARPADPPVPHLRHFAPEVPDGFGRTLGARVRSLIEAIEAGPDCVLVGVGFGAAVAVGAAARCRQVRALLLLGPSLDVRDPDLLGPNAWVPATLPTTIVHGESDVVASLDDSRSLVARCPHVTLVVVRDGHELQRSEAEVVAALRELWSDAAR